MLDSFEVNSIFLDPIKSKQFEDKKLNELQNKLVHRKVEDATLNVTGLLRFKGRLCAPRVSDLIYDVILAAHGSYYSIHLGITKVYGNLRQLYWWPRMMRDIVG